jgi:hypothetical protein
MIGIHKRQDFSVGGGDTSVSHCSYFCMGSFESDAASLFGNLEGRIRRAIVDDDELISR